MRSRLDTPRENVLQTRFGEAIHQVDNTQPAGLQVSLLRHPQLLRGRRMQAAA